jgi:hypothetical protein
MMKTAKNTHLLKHRALRQQRAQTRAKHAYAGGGPEEGAPALRDGGDELEGDYGCDLFFKFKFFG